MEGSEESQIEASGSLKIGNHGAWASAVLDGYINMTLLTPLH